MQRFRLISILIFLPMMIVPVILNGPEYLFRYITQWGIEFAIISTLLTYYSAKNPSSLMLKRLSIVTLEIAIFLNFGNLVTFWTTFAPFYFCCIENYWIVALSWSHIVPQFLLLANLFLSDARILRKDVMWGLSFASLYLVIDYVRVICLESGITYEFLHWNSIISIHNSLKYLACCVILYLIIWYGNEKFKRMMKQDDDRIHQEVMA